MNELPYLLSDYKVVLSLFGTHLEFAFCIEKPLIVDWLHYCNFLGFQELGVLFRPCLVDQVDGAASYQVLPDELGLHRFP